MTQHLFVARWDHDAAVELIAAERIKLLGETRSTEQQARLESLNADMNALCPRVTKSMIDQLSELVESLARMAPAPMPLTDEQIDELIEQQWGAHGFARAIERAHGIGTHGSAAAPEGKRG